MLPLIAIALLATAVAGYSIACFLTGENLMVTLWDEWRLQQTELRRFEEIYAANPHSCDVIVSLTTIPSRLELIAPTLKSLLRQTVRPKEIRLCLPTWSVRENRTYDLPPWLRQLREITIVTCEDEGPATKFLSTLRSVAPNQAVLVLDDDRVYHPRLLAHYSAVMAAHPNAAIGGGGWNVPADHIDRPTTLRRRLRRAPHIPARANQVTTPRRIDIVMGVHSYLVRPRFFSLTALGNNSAAPAAIRRVDDVWISAHCLAPRWVYPLRAAYVDYLPWRNRVHNRATSLGRLNFRPDDAQRGNSIALLHFRDRW